MASIEIIAGATSQLEPWLGFAQGLLGAVVGAAVAGAISFVLQVNEHKQAAKARQEDLLLRRRSVAHRMVAKLIYVHADLVKIERHMDGAATKRRPGMEPWQYVEPFFITAKPVQFDGEEIALLLDLDLKDDFNRVYGLERCHQQHLEVHREYTARRERMAELWPGFEFEDGVASFMPSKKDLARTGPHRQALNDLISYQAAEIGRDAAEVGDALEKLCASFHRTLGTNITVGGLKE